MEKNVTTVLEEMSVSQPTYLQPTYLHTYK